jgi:tRNA-modifying protein YgfZ
VSEYVDISGKTILSMEGRDCLDFLQRISTNNILSIEPGKSVQTVLTNEKGRIVDVVNVLKRIEGGLLLLGESQRNGLLQSWVEKFIIMEDIKIEDVTHNYIQFLFYGPEINSEIHFLDKSIAGVLVATEAWDGCQVFRVVAGAAKRESAELEFSQLGFQSVAVGSYDEFRIRHGIAASPNELCAAYNPLEAGLGHLINWTKGCYIGQEVIARLDTYKKIQKSLVRLQLDEFPQQLPTALLWKDSECGTVTSAIQVSGTQKSIGLGYLKSGVDAAGGGIFCVSGKRKIAVVIERKPDESS